MRLIDIQRVDRDEMMISFNSRLVRLIVERRLLSTVGRNRFNSRLVRLIECCGVVMQSPHWLFQFQIGAIDSLSVLLATKDDVLFQFQIGAIDRTICFNYRSRFKSVSIPDWCD